MVILVTAGAHGRMITSGMWQFVHLDRRHDRRVLRVVVLDVVLDLVVVDEHELAVGTGVGLGTGVHTVVVAPFGPGSPGSSDPVER
jgi:hypothetical protein